MLGYCPQFGALNEHLTVRQTLVFYGRLRGIPGNHLQEEVDGLTEKLMLTEGLEMKAATLR